MPAPSAAAPVFNTCRRVRRRLLFDSVFHVVLPDRSRRPATVSSVRGPLLLTDNVTIVSYFLLSNHALDRLLVLETDFIHELRVDHEPASA